MTTPTRVEDSVTRAADKLAEAAGNIDDKMSRLLDLADRAVTVMEHNAHRANQTFEEKTDKAINRFTWIAVGVTGAAIITFLAGHHMFPRLRPSSCPLPLIRRRRRTALRTQDKRRTREGGVVAVVMQP